MLNFQSLTSVDVFHSSFHRHLAKAVGQHLSYHSPDQCHVPSCIMFIYTTMEHDQGHGQGDFQKSAIRVGTKVNIPPL